MRKKIIIIMTAIVLFGGFIAGYRNINQKYPARKVETAEKGESLEFLDGVKISANGIKWLSTEEQEAIYKNYRSECMFKEYNGGRKRSANHLSVVRDNRRWNSNLTGTSNGKFRTLRFYGRKIRTRRRESSYVSI